MDFNSLLRMHLQGGEQGFLMPREGNDPENSNGQEPATNIPEEMIHSGSALLQTSTTEQYYGLWPGAEFELVPDEGVATGYNQSPNPQQLIATATPQPSVSASALQIINIPPDQMLYLQENLLRQVWVQANQEEPPVQPNDPLVALGLVMPYRSRFDAFIENGTNEYTCRFIIQGTMGACGHTNYRRDRLRAHLLSHFSYRPYMCGGKCGKSNCTLGFADGGLLTEHLRRTTKPRVQCEYCDLEISPQNYRRHLATKHGHAEQS